jgi:prepilin-type N-terminal cleavage/methylation domain-containing protein
MQSASSKSSQAAGFTLIEMSIVLVIIGLIIGGVLVGQDLIRAAAVRAQISQIEKYNTAVNTFYGKYGALPGDMNDTIARQFGFATGVGNSDGIVSGSMTTGERAKFWEDLSTANGLNIGLIDGSFSMPTPPGGGATGTFLANYMPQAKIGNGNYIYVWSGGQYPFSGVTPPNYFGLSAVSNVSFALSSTPTIRVSQAYAIDTKTDDGLPTSGRVMAVYIDSSSFDQSVGWTDGDDYNPPNAETIPITGAATTCFDNGGVAGVPHYSIEINSGAGANCALSFQFQSGD